MLKTMFPKNPENFIERLQMLAESTRTIDIAEWAGLSYNTINNYVNAGRAPSAEILVKLAETKGINIHWLLTGVGQPYDQEGLKRVERKKEEEKRQEQARITANPTTPAGAWIIHVPAFEIRITRGAGDELPNSINVPIPVLRIVNSADE
jgi:transcriptional regulator with XRE-family HTH domain